VPTYVYRGINSGTTFEVQQRITEDPLTHHPETGEPVVRVIQAAGIVFKGSGFYKTDSRSSSPSSSGSKSSSGANSGDGAGSSSGSDSTSVETGSRSGEDFSAFTKRDSSSAD
jgi:putative FmdB family regulatory protein